MTAKIFIGHPVFGRRDNGEVEWKFPLHKVREFGEPRTLLHFPDPVFDNATIRSLLWQRLQEENFDPAVDLFLIAGDSTVTCLMVEVAIAHWGRAPRYLRWDKRRQQYDVVGG